MAASLFSIQDSANQVGGSFVTQYYNVLHQNPEQVYQFYKNESTMTRIDGNNNESATGIIEIHSLISALKFSSIEIKTANFLNSLMGGIMVMVSGLVQSGQYEKRRKFIQAFFLATQETGYFILNDFFHYVDEKYFCTPALLAQGNSDNLTALNAIPEAVRNEIVGSTHAQGNGHSSYDYLDLRQNMASQPESLIDEALSYSISNVTLSDHFIVPVDEPVSEPIRHTYASILKCGVGESGQTATQSPPFCTSSPVIFEQQKPDWSYASLSDKSSPEEIAEKTSVDYEVESKSVFVKNVSRYFTEVDLENLFNKFGPLACGVAIRSHKETGRYYAFIEYEETEGVQNALKASPVEINGWRLYVEERRKSKSSNGLASRGRGRGRRGGRMGGRGRGRSRVNGFEEDSNPELGVHGGRARGRRNELS